METSFHHVYLYFFFKKILMELIFKFNYLSFIKIVWHTPGIVDHVEMLVPGGMSQVITWWSTSATHRFCLYRQRALTITKERVATLAQDDEIVLVDTIADVEIDDDES